MIVEFSKRTILNYLLMQEIKINPTNDVRTPICIQWRHATNTACIFQLEWPRDENGPMKNQQPLFYRGDIIVVTSSKFKFERVKFMLMVQKLKIEVKCTFVHLPFLTFSLVFPGYPEHSSVY